MQIGYGTPSQRRHHRLNVPLRIQIRGESYIAADWSINGLKFRTENRDAFTAGEVFGMALTVPFQEFRIEVQLQSRVVRVEPTGFVAIQYVDPPMRACELLQHFSENLLRGEMAPIADTIRRLDLPSTPPRPEAPLVAGAVEAKSSIRRTWRKAAVYMTLGVLLASFLSWKVYKGLVVVSSDHAMVYTPSIDVTGPGEGIVSAVHVKEGQQVAAGDTLLTVRSPQLEQLVFAAQQEVGDLKIARDRLATLVAKEKSTLAPYRQITDDQLVAARARLAAAQQSVRLLELQHQRMSSLIEGGYVSKFELDSVETALQRARANVQAEQAELRIAETAKEAAGKGSYYTANRLEGDLPQLESDLEAARGRVALAEAHQAELQRQAEALTLKAPTAGRVRQLVAFEGAAIRSGSALLSLQAEQSPTVYALIPAEKLAKISIGNKASVFVPAVSSTIDAEVIAIEPRTWALPDGLRQMLGDPADLALVILQMKGPQERLAGVAPGLPASVEFGGKGVPAEPGQEVRLAAR